MAEQRTGLVSKLWCSQGAASPWEVLWEELLQVRNVGCELLVLPTQPPAPQHLPGTNLGQPHEFLLPERALVSGPWVTREVITGIVLLSILVIYSLQHTTEVSGLLLLLFFSPLTSGGKNRCNLLFPGLLCVPHSTALQWGGPEPDCK